MMQVITGSFSGTVFTFFMAKFNREIEELLVSPASNLTIMVAYTSIGIARGVLTGLCVMLVSLFFE